MIFTLVALATLSDDDIDELVFVVFGLRGSVHIKDFAVVCKSELIIAMKTEYDKLMKTYPTRMEGLAADWSNVTAFAAQRGLPIDEIAPYRRAGILNVAGAPVIAPLPMPPPSPAPVCGQGFGGGPMVAIPPFTQAFSEGNAHRLGDEPPIKRTHLEVAKASSGTPGKLQADPEPTVSSSAAPSLDVQALLKIAQMHGFSDKQIQQLDGMTVSKPVMSLPSIVAPPLPNCDSVDGNLPGSADGKS